MHNKYIFFLVFLILFACSKEENLQLSKSENIFEPKNISLSNKKGKFVSKIEVAKEINEIANTKSYNLTNSLTDFPLKKIWQINTKQEVNDKNPYLPEPLLLNSNIYLLNNGGYLFKINAETGKLIWKKLIFSEIENTVIGTPAMSGKINGEKDIILYAHNGSNELLSVDGINGKVIWKKTLDLPIRGGITSFKNNLFTSDFDGNFLSLNNKNGEILWKVYLGIDYNSVYSTARPIIAQNKIIVPTTGGTFFVIAINNGEVLWSENISSNYQLPKLFHAGDIVANPIYHNGVIYIVSQSGYTAAFDLETSSNLWSIPIGGFQTPTISGETMFLVGNMGLLAAIDIKNGNVKWKKQYPSYLNEGSYFTEEEIAIYKGPTLADSKLLVTNQSGLISIVDAINGEEISNLRIGTLALAPIPAKRKLLFLTANGRLLAYK